MARSSASLLDLILIMKVILWICTILGGISAVIFLHDRFAPLFPGRKPKKRGLYLFDDLCSISQAKFLKLKHLRIEGSCLMAGIILGLSGLFLGLQGYFASVIFGMVLAGFCSWYGDKVKAQTVTEEILASTAFVLLYGGMGAACLRVGLFFLFNLDPTSYPGSPASIFTCQLQCLSPLRA